MRDDDKDRFDPETIQPDIWPTHLWIGLGAVIYVGAPQFYDPMAAAAYFVLGGCFALAVLGSSAARFNKMMEPILKDLFPADGIGGELTHKALHWLMLGMEGLAVMHLSRLTIVALAVAPTVAMAD